MKDQIILDDGEYYIDLNGNYESSTAPGFLSYRCGNDAGFECVGSFDKSCDGTWKADVQAAQASETESDCRQVARGVKRIDAIAALWVSRQTAYCSHKK